MSKPIVLSLVQACVYQLTSVGLCIQQLLGRQEWQRADQDFVLCGFNSRSAKEVTQVPDKLPTVRIAVCSVQPDCQACLRSRTFIPVTRMHAQGHACAYKRPCVWVGAVG